jgi:hypothetical protein
MPGAISKLIRPRPSWTPATSSDFKGTKTFEQIISPQNSDVHELPPLAFSFFNPDDGQYHTLTQPAVPLVVKAAGATPLPALAAKDKNSAPENQTPQDILPIKENPGNARANRSARRAARISRRAIRAGAGVSRRVHLAQTHGQSGEQSAPAPPARRGATHRRRHRTT